MRRFVVALSSAAILIFWGCGKPSYDARLNRTLEEMKYRKRLDENLMPAPSEGVFPELLVFVRPPKDEAPSKVFSLGEINPAAFEIANSFLDTKDNHFLHILARKKAARKAPAKGQPAAPEVPRGEFTADVLAFLSTILGATDELQPSKLKAETKKTNEFRRLVLAVDRNGVPYTVQVYFYKRDDYDVALIFQFPTADQAKLSSKINLALESFAVGNRAKNRFAGAISEEDTSAAPGPEVAF